MIKEKFEFFKLMQHHWITLEYYNQDFDLFVEWKEKTNFNKDLSYDVHALDKKSEIIYKKNYSLNEELDLSNIIFRSFLIVFTSDRYTQSIILNRLRVLCCKTKCFGAIAIVHRGDVLFFPKLKYQDVFLIKDIMSSQISNKNFNIAYASKKNLVLI